MYCSIRYEQYLGTKWKLKVFAFQIDVLARLHASEIHHLATHTSSPTPSFSIHNLCSWIEFSLKSNITCFCELLSIFHALKMIWWFVWYNLGIQFFTEEEGAFLVENLNLFEEPTLVRTVVNKYNYKKTKVEIMSRPK